MLPGKTALFACSERAVLPGRIARVRALFYVLAGRIARVRALVCVLAGRIATRQNTRFRLICLEKFKALLVLYFEFY